MYRFPVDYMIFTRLYKMLENRYSRPNYRGTNNALKKLYKVNDIMKNKKGRIGYLTDDTNKELIEILNRELYLQSDSKKGINYHGLIVLANSIVIHEQWLKEKNMKAKTELIDEKSKEEKPKQLTLFDFSQTKK